MSFIGFNDFLSTIETDKLNVLLISIDIDGSFILHVNTASDTLIGSLLNNKGSNFELEK